MNPKKDYAFYIVGRDDMDDGIEIFFTNPGVTRLEGRMSELGQQKKSVEEIVNKKLSEQQIDEITTYSVPISDPVLTENAPVTEHSVILEEGRKRVRKNMPK